MNYKLSLVIPTYNEAKNIENLCMHLVGVFCQNKIDFEIIVVDDASPDGTSGIVAGLSRQDNRIRLMERKNEKGLGTAVVAGWKAARGEILGVIDGDFQHPPEIIPLMLEKLFKNEDIDIVVASRNVSGGGVSKWSPVRRFVSWLATTISYFFLPDILEKVNDPMSGYFMLKNKVIQGVRLNPLGYKIILEVLSKGNYRKVEEVPYFFRERKRGGSKAGLKQYLTSLVYMFKLSVSTRQIYISLKILFASLSAVSVAGFLSLVLNNPGISRAWVFALALESATIFNFILNESWVFRGKSGQRPSFKARLNRLVKFNAHYAFIIVAISLICAWPIKTSTEILLRLGLGLFFIWNILTRASKVWNN